MSGDGALPGLVPGTPGGDRHWLARAVELSRRCPPSATAFSVGAMLVRASGEVIASGYSREVDPANHAEEAALSRAADVGADVSDATLYSSLEPCICRASRPTSCAELIVAAGVRRVVIAWREPPVFVSGGGAAWLAARGVMVVDVPGLAAEARAVNAHVLA